MTTVSLINSDKVAIIDSIYFEEVSKHNWSLRLTRNHQYASTKINGKTIDLHVLISILAKIPNLYINKFCVIDHIDDNGLNCQVYNIRYILHSENIRRSHKNPNKNIQFRPANKDNPYYVGFRHNSKQITVGSFKTLEEAILARDSFAFTNKLIVN